MAGADAILVILAMVSDSEARRLIDLAALLGMDALVEVHDAAECERAVGLEAAVIGVNARDLQTMEIDTTRQRELIASLPPTVVRIAESGIDSRTGVEAARDAGADAVLVGTALMRDPALAPRDRRACRADEHPRQDLRADPRPRTSPRRWPPAPTSSDSCSSIQPAVGHTRTRRRAGRRRAGGVRTVAVVASGDGPDPAITDLVQTYAPEGPLAPHDRGHPWCAAGGTCPPDVPLLLDLAVRIVTRRRRRSPPTGSAPPSTPGLVMLAGSLTPAKRRGGHRLGAPLGGRHRARRRNRARESRTTT